MFVFAAESTKELAEWILALRDVKVSESLVHLPTRCSSESRASASEQTRVLLPVRDGAGAERPA